VDALPLGPADREAALAAMTERELDVVVVGGGVVGAGAALDAATRGLSVALLEARDWASGTSSRSSKLIHGGLRYLEMLDFALVREALRERSLLLSRLAPHLVKPVAFLYPLTGRGWERPYVGAGLTLYDTLGTASGLARGVPHHRHLTRSGALRVAPALRKDSLVGAVQYYDAQVDDARHTMFLAPHAASYGAHCANRARVVGFLRQGERVTACGCATTRAAASSRSGRSRSSTRRASGPTTRRRWSASAGSSTCRRRRASTWSCPATGSSRRPA
jgi:glycerol-3-phosphate dehydrogenase